MVDPSLFREFGTHVTIYEPAVVIFPEKMVFKNHIIVNSFTCLNGGKGLYVGNHVDMSFFTTVIGGGYCILEDFVTMAAGCRIINGSEDIEGDGLINPTIPEKHRSFYRSFVHIQKHAFLATDVIVHPGVTIGEGAVIGSGSVVTTSLDPWGIYMGRPARRVKDRPSASIKAYEQKFIADHHMVPSDFSDVRREIDRVYSVPA